VSAALGDAEHEALQALGYDAAWLEAGILERGLLAEQHARFLSGGTRKTARYRSQAVTAWCAADGEVPDAQLEAFLGLIGDEPDAKLAHRALAELIRSPRLSLEGLERIARADPKLVQRHVPLLRRTVLSRRLGEGVTDALIAKVIELQDAAIQTQLVRDPRLSRKHAEALAKHGANPTIRENAAAWFQDKKAWR
jgi:hypothetical protein